MDLNYHTIRPCLDSWNIILSDPALVILESNYMFCIYMESHLSSCSLSLSHSLPATYAKFCKHIIVFCWNMPGQKSSTGFERVGKTSSPCQRPCCEKTSCNNSSLYASFSTSSSLCASKACSSGIGKSNSAAESFSNNLQVKLMFEKQK